MNDATRDKKRWTPSEDAILRTFYPLGRADKVARLVGRTERAVEVRAGRLEISAPPRVRTADRERRKDLEVAPMAVDPTARPAPVAVAKPRGPAHSDGPATLHPNFKFTTCPSPAAALRTNTHSTY